MKWKITNLQTCLYLISAIILLVGLGSAILIYLTAANDSDNILSYENSKMYIHDLEVFGGKANVLMSEFRGWFVGLWHGKSLAFTITCITIPISFGFFFTAYHLRPDLKSGARDKNNRGENDWKI
jgi:hypothetical protein